ncbi:unnamed protein product, partial [Polarella glacialis]
MAEGLVALLRQPRSPQSVRPQSYVGSAAALGPVPLSPTRPGGPQLERQLEAIEARMLAMVAAQQVQHSADIREADKFSEFATKNMETRIEAVEHRQAALGSQVAELASAVKAIREQGRSEACRTSILLAAPLEASAEGLRAEAIGRTSLASADAALQAVHELQSLVRAELKGFHRRFELLQDALEDRALAPLREVELQLREQNLA